MTIVFFPEPEGHDIEAAFHQSLSRISEVPMLGLVLKMRVRDSGNPESPVTEELANWMIVDETYVKALASQLPPGKESKPNPEA